MPVVALTALQQLHGFKAGESALVIGASGGVGSAALQIAKALGASRVAAVCSSSNATFVKSLGADEVVDYAIGDEAMIAALSKTRFDRVVDTVTSPKDKDYWLISAACVAPTGTTVAINGGIGMMTAMLFMLTGLQLQSARARTIVCVPNAPELTQLVDMMAAGKLKAVVAETFPLEETAVTDAYRRLEARRVKGNLVCKVA
jgi:NADPH:quinone reductase-like Zn-dependent oxidoreductase